MYFVLPRLYAVTDARLSGLSHAEQLERLAAAGATLVQLREKHLSPRQFYYQAEEALQVARRYGVTLVINDRVDIALALGAGGVHLGQEDLAPEAARRLLGNRAIIGRSAHSVEQALLAAREPIDYLAIGPVFETSTKENPDPIVGLDGVRRVREAVGQLPLVAVGGIGFSNVARVLEAGADSVAVIAAIISQPEQIESNARKLLALAEA
jgi:thiamine-phosphate pyrophosphorylase